MIFITVPNSLWCSDANSSYILCEPMDPKPNLVLLRKQGEVQEVFYSSLGLLMLSKIRICHTHNHVLISSVCT